MYSYLLPKSQRLIAMSAASYSYTDDVRVWPLFTLLSLRVHPCNPCRADAYVIIEAIFPGPSYVPGET